MRGIIFHPKQTQGETVQPDENVTDNIDPREHKRVVTEETVTEPEPVRETTEKTVEETTTETTNRPTER
jgi:hypothetical protein